MERDKEFFRAKIAEFEAQEKKLTFDLDEVKFRLGVVRDLYAEFRREQGLSPSEQPPVKGADLFLKGELAPAIIGILQASGSKMTFVDIAAVLISNRGHIDTPEKKNKARKMVGSSMTRLFQKHPLMMREKSGRLYYYYWQREEIKEEDSVGVESRDSNGFVSPNRLFNGGDGE